MKFSIEKMRKSKYNKYSISLPAAKSKTSGSEGGGESWAVS